jgi:uncharacterized protein
VRSRGWLLVVLLAVAALLLAGRAITSLIVDHEWFAAMGMQQLWWERTTSTFLLQGGLALAGTLFALANFTAVRSTILAVAVPQRVGNIELTAMIPGQRLVWLTVAFALLVGCALATPFDDWTTVAMARHGIPFGEIETYHDRDLGFYVYWLPFEETLYVWALLSIVVMTAVVMVLYALTRSLRMDGRRIIASSHVRRHMSVLGALVLLLLAWSYRLDAFDLLREGSGIEDMFLRVDHMVTLRVDVALAVLSAVAAVLLLRAGWLGHVRTAMVIVGGMLVLAAGLRHVLPSILARGNTLGDPGRRDADYIATRALVSRRAYDSDGVQMGTGEAAFRVETRIPVELLGSRLSMWDAAGIERMNAQQVTVGATTSQAVRIAPSISATTRGTIGLLTVRAGTAGEPWHLLMRDLASSAPALDELPWGSSTDSLDDADDAAANQPLVAPGLSGHALIVDRTGTIPGARLQSVLSRLSHAWSARDPSLLNSDSTGSPAVYVPFRDVRERVEQLAPVFAQGSNVLPLLHDGKLYWTLELYSASEGYPLSQQWFLAGAVRSYFRHAGTALIDAATGRVRIITVRQPDPIAKSWMALTPTLWVPIADIPRQLADALPPVTDGAIAQLRTYAKHGSRSEGNVSRYFPDSALTLDRVTPIIVQAGDALAPAWTVPVLDDDERLGGIGTAIGGRVRATYWDTTSAPRPTWATAGDRLRAALDSARGGQAANNRREPRVLFGRIHGAMTTAGPVLAQAVHISGGEGALPVMQVALLMGERVSTGKDLFDASSRLTGVVVAPPGSGTPAALPRENRDVTIQRLYDVMREALRRADWTRFGSAFDSLGRLIGRPPQ